jgi:hypothetical protein
MYSEGNLPAHPGLLKRKGGPHAQENPREVDAKREL